MAKIKRSNYIKSNRVFTPIRKYGWIFTFLVAIGGLWYPKLGLLVIGIMLSLTIMGFFRGRYWCGNFCTHGSLYDMLTLPLSFNRNIPNFLRNRWAAILMLTWFIIMFSSRLREVFKVIGTAPFVDQLGYVFVMTYLVVTVVGSLLAIFISPRTWCYICPMGTMQIGAYKLSKALNISPNYDKKIAIQQDLCKKCGQCAKVCPMQLKPHQSISTNGELDHEACIRCSTCVVNCPVNAMSLTDKDSKIRQSNYK